MNILVASNNLKTTGLGTFIYTQVSELISRGHNVDVVTFHNGKVGEKLSSNVIELDNVKKSYDLILTHQNDITFELINRNVSGYVIFTVHGLVYENDIPNEHLLHYVDKVFCVSQVIQKFLSKKNIDSSLIYQLVDCERFSPKNMLREKNIKVLSMVRGELNTMIRCACEILDYEYIGWQKPVDYYFHLNDEDDVIFNVEDRINEADIVVGIGRIIYESLSCGRNALVFDAREYQGNLGDGMVTPDNIDNFIMDNFSGRYNNKSFDLENLVEELKKYDSTYSNFFRNHIKTNFNVKDLIDKYLELV
jgi:glycosyltransferase involved in cell wall biosynthesis